MKNKKTITLTAIILAVVTALAITASAAYDSSEDPIISLSYLENIFKIELLEDVDDKLNEFWEKIEDFISDYVKDNQPITAEMLKEALGDDEPTKIILIKTCWQDSRGEENWFDFWQSHDFWDEAPYMTEDAADWLTSLKPNVIGFDFPQDYDIRKLRFGVDERHCYLTTHRHCLRYEIMMIEYMSNFRELKSKYVEFVGLPTALENADGAQIRCVAIVDED